MPGRTLVERASLIVFIIALAAVTVVFISRNSAADAPRATTSPAPAADVSQALGLRTHVAPAGADLSGAMMAGDRILRAGAYVARLGLPPAREPTLEETLIAAAQLQAARDWYIRTGVAPAEPTLQESLVAADQLRRLVEWAEGVEAAQAADPAPEPSLRESMIAADQLRLFAAWAEATSPQASAQPPQAPVEPAPADTAPPPPPPPPPAPTNSPVPPPPAPTATAVPQQPSGSGTWDTAFESEVFGVINQRRAQEGLGALSVEPRLAQAARDYAKVLADFNWFSHTGPDGSDLVSRTEAAGFPFTVQIGEVIAWGSDGWPPADIVQAWIDSPSHRDQILSGVYNRAGIGCYFTDEGGTDMVRCVMDLAE